MFTIKSQTNLNQEISQDKLEKYKRSFLNIIEDPNYGFWNITQDNDYLKQAENVFKQTSSKKHIYHIGIGGSSLGPKMLINSLQLALDSKRDFTFIDNIGPDYIFEQLLNLNQETIKDSIFYFVSKSGGTAETIAVLNIISNILKQKFNINSDQLKDYFIFCTTIGKGDLFDLSKKLQITSLSVPENIGGRFSVLSHVGLLPALWADLNIKDIWNGANQCKEWIKTNNSFYQLAYEIYQMKKSGVNQTVLMPYSSKLKDLSFWFVQLWAESLGKLKNKQQEIVREGLTPIPAYGATDQHSQMQLFMEGPLNKLLMLIEVENFRNDFNLSSDFTGKSFNLLNGHNMSDLYKAEIHGTYKALEEANRPFFKILIDKVSEKNIGALILFFESLTALMGEILNIDTFNQPGVEAGKIFAYEFLNMNK